MKKKLLLCLFVSTLLGVLSTYAESRPFVTRWKGEAGQELKIPILGDNYKLVIKKADGTVLKTETSLTVTTSEPYVYTPTEDGELIVEAGPERVESIIFVFKKDYRGSADNLLVVEKFGTVVWKNLRSAFQYCKNMKFADDIDVPVLTSVEDMAAMFRFCDIFNSPLTNWDVRKVTTMELMFEGCKSFNQPLNTWDVSKVTEMGSMFHNCAAFDQPLNTWNVSKVTDMNTMFSGCTSFNQPLNTWDVSKVTEMGSMFHNCAAFDQPLNTWNVSKVTDMNTMFSGCTSFNQPLNTWDVSNVTNMESMFAECSAFNQELGSWKLTKCERLGLEKCGMSLANYSSSLNAWAAQNDIKDGLNLVATDLKYISGVTEARNKLVNDKHWTITGDAPVDHYLNFKESSLVLKKGAEATLELTKKGVEDSETVTFTSSDATIVEIVDAATFKIKAVKEGKATLTATVAANASHGELKATCEVTVTVPVTGVTLSDTKIEVPKEKTHKLVATLQPTDASNQKVTWSTSDKDIATVAADGTVTGIKEGDATITVTTDEGKFTATCAVKVTPPTAVEDVVFATVVVAPNPFTALLRITNGELSGKYELFNAQGIVVSTGVLENTETRVNTAALATGVYLLRLTAANGATKTITVVKEK